MAEFIGISTYELLGIATGLLLVWVLIAFLVRQERRAWEDFANEVIIDDDNTRGI